MLSLGSSALALRRIFLKIVIISTYELGHQPFGLASPAAWLRRSGSHVTCLDLSRQPLQEEAVRAADVVAFYVPMHTATRLAIRLIGPVRRLNPSAHLCFYGLYAPVNEAYLRTLGVETIIGGEFESALAESIQRIADKARQKENGNGADETRIPVSKAGNPAVSLDRLHFILPDRSDLPPLRQYAHLLMPEGGFRVAGYTEASRGCKHLCRHCPIVPVYDGIFRIVPREIVLEDIRQQVAASAEHITFGDPDFFNGPTHAMAIVEAVHREFPRLSYDVTIKIEHLLKHADCLRKLRDTGCLFVTSAVESVDDSILARLAKGHTRADFLAVLALFRELSMILQPTFVPFTPWTSLSAYRELLALLADKDLIENVAPIQLGIRLLIPAGSRLLELEEVRNAVGDFDSSGLVYPWRHADVRMDILSERVQELASAGDRLKRSRADTFVQIWQASNEFAREKADPGGVAPKLSAPKVPHFTEPWYCCAEPTQDQFISITSDARPPVQSDTFF
jgi:Radical SAM superfamily